MQQIDSYPISLAEQKQIITGDAHTISVVIACYNVEKYIARCVESFLHQTYSKVELILVDDGSTDRTGQICDAYAAAHNGIKVLHQANTGQGEARNRGVLAASGEYISFADADDYAESQLLEILYTVLREFDADVSICSYFQETEQAAGKGTSEIIQSPSETMQNDKVRSEKKACVRLNILNKDELLTCLVEEDEKCPIRNAVWNKLYKKTLLQDLRMSAHKYEDILYTVQVMAGAQKACYIDMPLYHYIIDRKDSTMNHYSWNNILQYQIPAYREKDQVLIDAGRADLAVEHDYMVYKKLLLLYTQARREKTVSGHHFMKELEPVLRGSREQFEQLYSCRIADPHQKMRMRMFLLAPVLYNVFMDLNDRIILPLRQKGHTDI